jgi:hypothetical protein
VNAFQIVALSVVAKADQLTDHGVQVKAFQIVALSVLGAVLVWELAARRRTGSRGFWLFRCLVWAATAAAIADPNLVQRVARLAGIGRGADVVFYLFVLLFLAASFYFYGQKVRLQQQITELVRHLALQEPRRGTDAADQAAPPAAPPPGGGSR